MTLKNLYPLIALVGATTLSAPAQSTLSAPITLYSGYLMLTWDPVNEFQTRTSGQTTVIYFSAPSYDPEMGPRLGSVGSWSGNPNGITTGEVASGTVLGNSSLFSSWTSFQPQNYETGSYIGIDYADGSGNRNYGWLEFSTTADSLTVDAAYMDITPNEAVVAGQLTPTPTPEPSTLALTGVGIAGWFLVRRKK